MFRLVRFFILTSAVAAVAITVVLVVYWQNETDGLIEAAESQNVTLTRAFANVIWPRFSSYVMSTSELNGDDLAARPETRAIGEAAKAVSVGLPVLKIKIYNPEGLTVFSSEPSEIGEDKSDNPGVYSVVRNGESASKVTFHDTASSFEGASLGRNVVETYLPIRRDEGPVEGIFELYTDVTPVLASIRRTTSNLVISFFLIFGPAYGLLLLIVWRADRTIKQQHAEITEKNAALNQAFAECKRIEQALRIAHDELEARVEERTRDLREQIAERKRAEDEALRHRNQLAHFGRVSVMGEMASGLAHELNQPLTVISGCTQICLKKLRSGGEQPEALLHAVEQAAEQAERANQIIRRIRGFIRKEERNQAAIDLNKTIGEVADLLRADAREHGATVTLELADDLPLVVADSIEIQQVVLNLAHNAIEAMSGSRSDLRKLTIHSSGNRHGAIEVAVSDTGEGIPAGNLDRVFDHFFTTKATGVGMGLAISRSIVEAHGGRLWATSDGEAGAVFHFTLPIAETSHHDDA